MIDSDVLKNITMYKARSADFTRSQQLAYIPTLDGEQIEYTVRAYTVHNRRILRKQETEICFRLKYIRTRYGQDRKFRNYADTTTDLITLVNENIIYPIALFVNGLFIPYELLRVAICKEAAYLTLDLAVKDDDPAHIRAIKNTYKNMTREIEYAQILELPDYFEYWSTGSTKDLTKATSTGFRFNAVGKFSTKDTTVFALTTFKQPKVELVSIHTEDSAINAYKVSDNAYRKLTSDNVFVFQDGLFTTGKKENIKRAMDWEIQHEPETPKTPCIELLQDDTKLPDAPTIEVTSTLVSISGGKVIPGVVDVLVFASDIYDPTADNFAKLLPSGLVNIIRERNEGALTPNWVAPFEKEFDFTMDRAKNYATNVADMIKYMMKYNPSAFKYCLLRKSNLYVEEENTDWIKKILKDDGTIWIPRMHSEMTDEFILMLVNGELYKYDFFTRYIANFCVMPIQGIPDDATIELLRFQNVNNAVFDFVVNKEDGFKYYSPEIVNDEMVLYSYETVEGDPYEFPDPGTDFSHQHFPIGYTLETRESDGYIKITLEDDEYYGKALKLAYKNRFAHYSYVIDTGDDEYLYRIDLRAKFKFCNEYSRYMVFHNGKRLSNEFYRLVLPMRKTTPFFDFYLYTALPVSPGDRIDIVYAPCPLQDIAIKPEVERTGDIVLDKAVLDYGLSTDMYLVWINGRKIPKSQVKDLDSYRMRIVSNQPTTKDLAVTKYIPEIEDIVKDFKENLSTWDQYLQYMSDPHLLNTLNVGTNKITGTDPAFTEDALPIRSVMLELLREQFAMNPRVFVSDHFLYDYTDVDQSVAKYDPEEAVGDLMLEIADGSAQDSIEEVFRPMGDKEEEDQGEQWPQ